MGPARTSASASHTPRPADPDVTVPPQAAEVVVRCPVRTELDHAPALEPLRRTPPLVQTLRRRAAQEFRSSVLREVMDAPARTVVIQTHPPQGSAGETEAERATLAAVESDAQVIVGPVPPADHLGHRLSLPDLLVRCDWSDGSTTSAGWLPAIIKHHRLTRDQEPGSGASCSPLADLDPAHARAAANASFRAGTLGDDSLRLAHHWRTIEAHGLTPADGRPVGLVIDKERAAWWIPLDEPRWNSEWSATQVSALDRYDQRFSLRLDAIANRLRRNLRPDLDRLIAPVRISECDECPWYAVCNAELEAADHVSLVPGFRYGHAAEHLRRGVFTRADLAQLDWRTAAVTFGSSPNSEQVDLLELRSAATDQLPSRTVEDALGPDHPAIPRLREHEVRTVADLNALDAHTASYSGSHVGHLPSAIDQARAAVADRVFRARGLERLEVPRADVEVDVDMENVDAGVYLWGTYTTLRGRAAGSSLLGGVDEGYRPFLTWDPMDAEAAATVFAEFWRWLSEVRRCAAEAGLTFAAYCYTGAEYEKMRQILSASPGRRDLPSPEEIEDLVSSPRWVDLYQVVRSTIVTGGRLGLKKVAPLAGFEWRDTDPGGEQSMYWHERAVFDPDPEIRTEHRQRILAYNEDDVLATLAVRNWLAEADLPAIERWHQHT